jgi:hypothetical protein
MVLDNSALISTAGAPSGEDVMKVMAGLGGGVGASIVLKAGSVTGAALLPVWVAAGAGLGATVVASAVVGTTIGETDFVKDNLVKLLESIWPIEEPGKPEIKRDGDGKYMLSYGKESFDINFYADLDTIDAVTLDSGYNIGADVYSNPMDAANAALQLKLIGSEDLFINGCSHGVPALML